MRIGLSSLVAVAVVLPLVSFACGGGSKTTTTPTASASLSVPSASVGGPDAIDGALMQLAARVAPGMTAEGPPAKLSVLPQAHQQLPLGLQAGKCYAVLGVGPAGSDLDLVLAMNNQPIGQDGETDNTATLGTGMMPLCPPQPTQLSLDVALKSGSGVVGVQLYSKAAPAIATTTTATTPSVDPIDAMLKTEIAKLAKGMDPDGPPTKGTIQEGAKLEAVTTLQAGRCYSIVAVSPTGGVTSLDMDLLMAPFFTVSAGKNSKSGNVALIGGSSNPLCPIALFPVPYRIDVTAKKGSGPVAIQVLSKTK
jgi:hypothetical protein